MSNPDDPASWTARADNDLLCISNNLNDPRVPWDVVCFHAQQAAEKMLKALIVAHGGTPARTHDLAALMSEAAALGASVEHLRNECDLLTPYAVAFRYPGVAPDPDETEGQMAVDAARRIYAAARAILNATP